MKIQNSCFYSKFRIILPRRFDFTKFQRIFFQMKLEIRYQNLTKLLPPDCSVRDLAPPEKHIVNINYNYSQIQKEKNTESSYKHHVCCQKDRIRPDPDPT